MRKRLGRTYHEIQDGQAAFLPESFGPDWRPAPAVDDDFPSTALPRRKFLSEQLCLKALRGAPPGCQSLSACTDDLDNRCCLRPPQTQERNRSAWVSRSALEREIIGYRRKLCITHLGAQRGSTVEEVRRE